MPARTEDRRSARMALLAPFVLAVLFVFWFLSGVIGLISLDVAAKVLVDVGWPDQISRASVVFWAIIDIAIAAGAPHSAICRACLLGNGRSQLDLSGFVDRRRSAVVA